MRCNNFLSSFCACYGFKTKRKTCRKIQATFSLLMHC